MVRTTKTESKSQAPVANVVVEQTAAPKNQRKSLLNQLPPHQSLPHHSQVSLLSNQPIILY